MGKHNLRFTWLRKIFWCDWGMGRRSSIVFVLNKNAPSIHFESIIMFGTTFRQNCLERHLSPVLLKSKIKKCYECFVPVFFQSFFLVPASILVQGKCAILLTQNSSYFYSLCTILNHQWGVKQLSRFLAVSWELCYWNALKQKEFFWKDCMQLFIVGSEGGMGLVMIF